MQHKVRNILFPAVMAVIAVMQAPLLQGCRGQKSSQPPIHLNPNMDNQEKYLAYGENHYFPDGSNMRPFVEGTVPRGGLRTDSAFFTGRNDSLFVKNPLEITEELLLQGQARYDIFCAVCHGLSGDGKGILMQKGFTPAPSFWDPRLIGMADGAIFTSVSDGIRTMPAMKILVPAEDRWAIVAYIRAIQRSRLAVIEDVPEDQRSRLE